MLQSTLLFVTGPTTTPQSINHFLLFFKNWEFNNASDAAHLVLLRNAYSIWQNDADKRDGPAPTIPPVPATIENAWLGASVKDVEAFLLDGMEGDSGMQFLVLDDQGVKERTVIVGCRRFDDERMVLTDQFEKTRVPWEEAQVVCANLEIGNVGFEEYCDQEVGGDGEGWWRFVVGGADVLSEENRRKRDEMVRRWEEEGLV